MIPVHNIESKQNWNMKSRFVDRNVLPAIDLLGFRNPQNRTRAEFRQNLFSFRADLLRKFGNREARKLRELRDFFLQRHLTRGVGSPWIRDSANGQREVAVAHPTTEGKSESRTSGGSISQASCEFSRPRNLARTTRLDANNRGAYRCDPGLGS